jgi:hypothetical protein
MCWPTGKSSLFAGSMVSRARLGQEKGGRCFARHRQICRHALSLPTGTLVCGIQSRAKLQLFVGDCMAFTHDGIYSRTLMQAINPAHVDRMCIGGHHWFWPAPTTIHPPFQGVVKIEPGDLGPKATGRQWWFLGLQGLHYTSDRCRTFTTVLAN